MRSYWGIGCLVAMTQLGEITSMSAGETALAAYRWENRILLVFAPDVDSTHYLWQQEMLLNAESGLNERDVVSSLSSRTWFRRRKGRPRPSRQTTCGTPTTYCRTTFALCLSARTEG